MGIYIGSTVINTPDLAQGIAFWTAALGYVVRHASEDFAVLTDPQRSWSNVSLQLSAEPKHGPNRLHLDLYTTDQSSEVARLSALGARRIPWEYEEGHDHIVMVDPGGNEFCVIQSDQPRD